MIRIAMAEDDTAEALRLKELAGRYFQAIGEEYRFTIFSDGLEFIGKYRPSAFDVVFMDIEMPHLNGMEAAEQLRRLDKTVPLVFITNLKQYALKGYEYEALDFLVKPISYPAFSTMMSRVRKHIQQKPHADICITNTQGSYRVAVSDIYYVEIAQHYIIYHTANGDYRFWGALAEEEKRLPASLFCRCNKSYLVNLSYVTRVEGCNLHIAGDVLQISRGQKPQIMQRLMNYMERR